MNLLSQCQSNRITFFRIFYLILWLYMYFGILQVRSRKGEVRGGAKVVPIALDQVGIEEIF